MLLYLVEINIITIFLYGFYRLLFTNDTFFSWRRFMLLNTYLIALLVPFADFSNWIRIHEATQNMASTYAETVLSEATSLPSKATVLSWNTILLWIYMGGVCMFLLRFVIQLIGIYRLAKKTEVSTIKGIKVHIIEKNESPFSFFRWIFVNPEVRYESQLQEILIHEQCHVEQKHSIDVVLAELFTIVCWFNPFAWLLKREIRLNLEYLADLYVVQVGCDQKSYQYHLLGMTYHKNVSTILNNFNDLLLKKRIKMMNRRRSRLIVKAKYTLLIPVTATLLVVKNIESVAHSLVSNKIVSNEVIVSVNTKANNVLQKKPIFTSKISKESNIKKLKEQVYEMSHNRINTIIEKKAINNTAPSNVIKDSYVDIKDPELPEKNSTNVRIYNISFAVDTKGSVSSLSVTHTKDTLYNQKDLQGIERMSRDKPDNTQNKTIKAIYNLPISFKL
ncbi:M56 family metallopeptidase [Hoylesella pleuritidis]|uniref:Peptidase, M56 family n=1 Tax=Hoylesella pleuritidis F0068 TaxID=1081904 RepID=U2KJW3_9BACT|nr:M56 family metallopeptidase [Hoylesella pleuritidis]ERJ98776.1 peptidase, M56 family [Hoylesella pleuritidis F0068]